MIGDSTPDCVRTQPLESHMPGKRGRPCPSCGQIGFRPHLGVRVCSNCKAVGWIAVPDGMPDAKKQRCFSCEAHTLGKVFENAKVSVFYCSTCKATMIET